MIIGFFTGLITGIIRKILSLIIVVAALGWAMFNFDTVSSWVAKGREILSSKYEVEVNTNDGDFAITIDLKNQIDAWIAANKLNIYGDAQGTVYAGGTPLFNELTGETKDRYEYILSQHPELKELLK